MTYLKKIIFAASLAAASLGFSLSTNAALITHDLLLDDGFGPTIVGEITVRLIENGAMGDQELNDFESFSILGSDVLLTNFFYAVIDRDNVFDGLSDLVFDIVVAVGPFGGNEINGLYSLDFGLDLWDEFDTTVNPAIPIGFGSLSLSTARVVSEPSLLALFALALVGFGVRRKAK